MELATRRFVDWVEHDVLGNLPWDEHYEGPYHTASSYDNDPYGLGCSHMSCNYIDAVTAERILHG